MKANNLAICIPNHGCNKNCPYCVSKMTGYIDSNFKLMNRQTEKVKKLASISGCTSILITGKGEPFLGISELEYFLKEFREFPFEIQTNGIWLSRNQGYVEELAKQGANVIAFSLDRIEQFEKYLDMFKNISESGMIVRVTMNITDMIPADYSFRKFAELSKNSYVGQFSLRNIVIPNNITINTSECQSAQKWIRDHVPEGLYDELVNQLESEVKRSGFLLRSLPYGAMVYDYQGISVTYFDYCVQDSHNSNDIRSLIFQEDGHLYTTWNSKASKLI